MSRNTPNQTAINKENFWEKVSSMSHLESRKLIAFAIAESSKEIDGADPELISLRDFWKRNAQDNFLNDAEFKAAVKHTIKVTHDYFTNLGLDVENLKRHSPFIDHVIKYIESSRTSCSKVMYDFANYVCLVSSEPKENQAACFVSFPPEEQFLNCLDGSRERIEESHQNLLSSRTEFNLFLKAHKSVMADFVSDLKYHVFEGNMVHITPYLEYSLGLSENTAPHPESQIPAGDLWKMHIRYAAKLKEKILERASEVDDIIKTIKEDYPDADLTNFRYDDEVAKSIDSRLRLHKVSGESFVKVLEDDESCQTCELNQELIDKVCNKLYVLSLECMDKVLGSDDRFKFSNHELLSKLCELGEAGDYYTEETIETILEILEANLPTELDSFENQARTSYEDFMMAFEALSIMERECFGSGKAIFARIVSDLSKSNTRCIAGIDRIISEAMPSKARMIMPIEDFIERYKEDPTIIINEGEKSVRNLKQLFFTNYHRKKILDYIKLSDVDRLMRGLRIIENSYYDSGKYFESACRQLVGRSDALKIFEALSRKIADYNNAKAEDEDRQKLPSEFAYKCISSAAMVNDVATCRYIFENFEISSQIFNDENLMLKAASIKDDALTKDERSRKGDKLIDLLIEKHNEFHPNEDERLSSLMHLVKAVDDSGPLIKAAEVGNETFMQAIIDQGIGAEFLDDVNVICEERIHLPHVAAIAGKGNFIKFLGRKGFNLQVLDKNGISAFRYAAVKGHVSVIRALIESGVDINLSGGKFALRDAAQEGKKDVVIELGNILGKDSGVDEIIDRGWALIHYVVDGGIPNIIPALKAVGANMDVKTRSGNTALMHAVSRENQRIMEELIESGANLFEINDAGNPTLKLLLRTKNPNLIGSFFFTKNKENGDSFLHTAGHRDGVVTEVMRYHKFDVNEYHSLNKKEESPLTINAIKNYREVIEGWMGLGLDLNKCDRKGRSPIYMLAFFGKDSAARLLMELGADINHQNEKGDTALHLAVKERDGFVIRKLLELGADQFIENSEGKSSRDISSSISDHRISKSFSDLDSNLLNHFISKMDAKSVTNITKVTNFDLHDYLILATKSSDAEVVKALLRAGASFSESEINDLEGEYKEEILSYLQNASLDTENEDLQRDGGDKKVSENIGHISKKRKLKSSNALTNEEFYDPDSEESDDEKNHLPSGSLSTCEAENIANDNGKQMVGK